MTPTRVRAAMHTDLGRLRSRNEDACLVDDDFGLFAVADGMGGHPAGDVAAQVAVECLPRLVSAALEGIDRDTAPETGTGTGTATETGTGTGTDTDTGTGTAVETGTDIVGIALEQAVLALNEVVIAAAAAAPGRVGMGTTLVLALVSGRTAHVAHAGDSRAYLLRGHRLRRLTRDHSLAAALIEGGVLDEEEAARHPFAQSLTQAIGMPGTQPEVSRIDLADGDRLLLCSDGLTNMLPDEDIAALLAAGKDTGSTARALVDAANQAGGHDNITVVLVDLVAPDGHSA